MSKNDKKEVKIYLYCYSLGKEEVVYNLAKTFDTSIVVLKDRWYRLKAIGLDKVGAYTNRDLVKNAEDQPFIYLRSMDKRPKTLD